MDEGEKVEAETIIESKRKVTYFTDWTMIIK
jgi:hypothetical protein